MSVTDREVHDPESWRFICHDTGVPGCFVIQLAIPSLPFPIATVWYRWIGNSTAEILHSFVIERYRRHGLRTALHEQMIAVYKPHLKQIITANGTKEGIAWLEAAGFRKDRRTGDWMLKVR